MSIILSHNTALELLRARPPQAYPLIRMRAPVSLADGGTNYRELGHTDLRSFGISLSPVHVLVASGRRPCKQAGVRVHRCGLAEIPAGLLLELAPGVYACGPELALVQMARRLSVCATVVLGCELCGCYSHFSAMISGYYDRPPLTSKASIVQAKEVLKGLYGLNKLKRPLEFVLDGSRSPMETVLACELSMSPKLGGQGFESPMLNYEVPLDGPARAKTGTSSCKLDLSWPSKRMGVEYDSDTWHKDPKKDRARREALLHMGWTEYTVDLDQIHDHREFMRTVGLLSGAIPQAEVAPAPRDSRLLHQRLLRATRYGVGLEAALFPVPVARGLVTCHV